MTYSETAMRVRMFFLKHPKRWLLASRLKSASAAPVSVQINNSVLKEPGNQTVLTVARKNGIKIPYNCRAGICGTCEATVDGRTQKTCYTIVKDGMTVVDRQSSMSHWRQNMNEE